jgi:CheY-like chemotaxis protein
VCGAVRWVEDGSTVSSSPLEASLSGSEQRVGMLEVSVRDEGVGLSKENLKCVFEEGWQFQSKQLQAGQGSGLGLWIAKNIIQLHGGTISCESAGEGQGCTMAFRIPLFRRFGNMPVTLDGENQVSAGPPPSPSRSRGSGAQATSARVSGQLEQSSSAESRPLVQPTGSSVIPFNSDFKTILIADDSGVCRRMVKMVLEGAGYHCITCSDGTECVHIVMERCGSDGAAEEVEGQSDVEEGLPKIDLILLDYEVRHDVDSPSSHHTPPTIPTTLIIVVVAVGFRCH